MPSNKTFVDISVDGSAINNGMPYATAGFGIVIRLNGATAEFNSVLCPECDGGVNTNNRAELRAAHAALNFLHEHAKIDRHYRLGPAQGFNRPEEDHSFTCDDRIMDGTSIVGTIHTDSTFVERGATGVNRQNRHKYLWRIVNHAMECLTRCGMELFFSHIRGQSGDEDNNRADELSREMGHEEYDSEEGDNPRNVYCVTCRKHFDSPADMGVHLKHEVHAMNTWEGMFSRKAPTKLCMMTMPVEFTSGQCAKEYLEADIPWNSIIETNMGISYEI